MTVNIFIGVNNESNYYNKNINPDNTCFNEQDIHQCIAYSNLQRNELFVLDLIYLLLE